MSEGGNCFKEKLILRKVSMESQKEGKYFTNQRTRWRLESRGEG
jgi:hypothetical protein